MSPLRSDPTDPTDPDGGADDGAARHAAALSALRSDLEAVVERLDELAFEVLREAASAGRTTRPALERRLVRARNGVERACRILRDGPGADEDA